MESVTLPSASFVTLPRCAKSPRATWLMTASNSVMLRCKASFASWLLVALETLATARLRLSAMRPSSLSDWTSARARASPAASRSENSVRFCTGVTTELPRRHARIAATPSARSAAPITEPLAPLGKLPKSNSDTPPDSRPAWYASPNTMKSASPLTKTSVQIVELSRDFMPSSNPILLKRSSFPIPAISNRRAWINFQHPVQIQNQSQAIVVAKHADTMRYGFRRTVQDVLRSHGIRSNHLVRGNAQPQNVVLSRRTKRSNDNMLRQQSGPAAFRHGDVNQRHDRAAQVEHADKIGGRERQLRRVRPLQDFLDVQHWQAKPFASAAENAVLRFRSALFQRAKGFQQLRRIGVGRKRCQLEFVVHRISQAKRRTARSSSSRVNGFVT